MPKKTPEILYTKIRATFYHPNGEVDHFYTFDMDDDTSRVRFAIECKHAYARKGAQVTMQPTASTFDSETIRQQITPMVLISCGARNYVAGEDFLMFQVGSKPRIVEKVIVTYVAAYDTYTVRYVAMRRSDYSTIADESVPMVYTDQLPKVVRQMGDRS